MDAETHARITLLRAQVSLRTLAGTLHVLRSELAAYAQFRLRRNHLHGSAARATEQELESRLQERLVECDRSLSIALAAVAQRPESLSANDTLCLEPPTVYTGEEEGIRESATANDGVGNRETDAGPRTAERIFAELAAAPGAPSSSTGGPPDRARSRSPPRREPARRP